MQRVFKATNVVLILLCAMYFISYIVRQSISTAALEIRPEFGLSNTQTLFLFSVFGYPYLLFQIIGGLAGSQSCPPATLVLFGVVSGRPPALSPLSLALATPCISRGGDGFRG